MLYNGWLPRDNSELMNDADGNIFLSFKTIILQNLTYYPKGNGLGPDDRDNYE